MTTQSVTSSLIDFISLSNSSSVISSISFSTLFLLVHLHRLLLPKFALCIGGVPFCLHLLVCSSLLCTSPLLIFATFPLPFSLPAPHPSDLNSIPSLSFTGFTHMHPDLGWPSTPGGHEEVGRIHDGVSVSQPPWDNVGSPHAAFTFFY